MKKARYYLLFFLALSIVAGCEKEITGNFGNPNAIKEISIKYVQEYDSLGNELLHEYSLVKVEEKDTFWLRSYKYKDTLSVEYKPSASGKIDTIYVTKDTLIYYNDIHKKAKYIRFDTIKLEYYNKYTEVRTLIESNAKWKASEIAYSAPSELPLWAFPINQYGSGTSLLRIRARPGLIGVVPRKCITQQAYFSDSTVLYQFNIIRKGMKQK